MRRKAEVGSMSIRIGRFHVDWALGAEADRPLAAAAMNRLVDVVLEEVLDEALDSVVRGDELVAVRAVQVAPVRITRAQDAAAWAGEIGAAVAGVVAAGGPDVVRYRSRTAAVLDVLRRTALGDVRREWAWRMLGLWPAAGAPLVPDVIFQLLADDPPAIAPVLDAAGSALPAALDLLGPERLARLSATAWHALGSAPVTFPVRAAPNTTGPSAAVRDAATGPLGVAVRNAAAAAAPAAPQPSHVAAVAAGADMRTVALAALLVANADPLAVQGGRGTAQVAALLEAVAPARAASPGTTSAGRADDGATSTGTADDAPDRLPPAEENPPRDPAPPGEGSARESTPRALDRSSLSGSNAATTRWAGLLFCLHLLRRLLDPAAHVPAAPGVVRDDHALLADVGVAPALHALGTQLCARAASAAWDDAPDRDDPALLTFCGLTPGAAAPADVQRPDEVSALADDVVTALRSRLAGRPLADLEEPQLLAAVFRRHATVVSDPGWRRVDLRLDEVSVDLRAALLDIDPGWLPVLGCVVRFGYG